MINLNVVKMWLYGFDCKDHQEFYSENGVLYHTKYPIARLHIIDGKKTVLISRLQNAKAHRQRVASYCNSWVGDPLFVENVMADSVDEHINNINIMVEEITSANKWMDSIYDSDKVEAIKKRIMFLEMNLNRYQVLFGFKKVGV